MAFKFKLTEPSIGVQDRTGLLSQADGAVSFTLQRGSRGTATIILQIAAGSSYTVEFGWPAFIYESDDASPVTDVCVFAGTVDTVQWDWQGNDGYHTLTLTLVSLEQCFDTILVDPPKSYFGKTAGYIVNDLLSTYASGVPVTAGTISSGITEPTAVYDHDRLSDIFDTLATDCGFIWYVDPATQRLMFCVSTTSAAPFAIDSSQILWETLEWLQTRQDFRNRQTVRCDFSALNTRIERFSNTGSPFSVTVSLNIAGVQRAWIETSGSVATVDGTFTGQPNPGDTVTFGGNPYEFVASLDNTTPGQVLIGAAAADTLQNLVDAINVNPLTAGIGFSLPSGWNGGFIAGAPSGLSFTLYDRLSGTAGNSEVVTASATNFSWSAGTLSGGTDPSSTVDLDLSNDITFTKGDTGVNLLTSQTGTFLVIEYYPIGQDCISVEDTALVQSMAATEHGTGKYQQIEDDSQLADIVVAYNRALGNLNAYNTLPVSFSFQTDSPLLSIGQLLTIGITKPTGAGAFIDGNYVVQEVDAASIPGKDHLRYTVTVINATEVGTYVKFFEAMAATSSGSGGGTGSGSGGGGGSSAPVSPWGAEDFASASGTITPDGAKTYHVLDLAGNVSMDAPVGSAYGQPHAFKITCNTFDVTSWNAAFLGLTGIVLDTRSGVWNVLEFITDSGGSTFSLKSILLGVS